MSTSPKKAAAERKAAQRPPQRTPQPAPARAPAQPPAKKLDALDALAASDPKAVIALMLWHTRHQNPDMAVRLTEKDITGFQACTDYLKATPEVVILRPQGRPAQAPIPAIGNRRAVPGYDAEPPRPFVVVKLVQKGTDDMIRPVENNEEDNERRKAAEQLLEDVSSAGGLATALENIVRTKDYSEHDLRAAAGALRRMAAALRKD